MSAVSNPAPRLRYVPSRNGELGRHMSEQTIRLLLGSGAASDLTNYARSPGYEGERRVVVMDGRTITHRWLAWHDFTAACRASAARRLH